MNKLPTELETLLQTLVVELQSNTVATELVFDSVSDISTGTAAFHKPLFDYFETSLSQLTFMNDQFTKFIDETRDFYIESLKPKPVDQDAAGSSVSKPDSNANDKPEKGTLGSILKSILTGTLLLGTLIFANKDKIINSLFEGMQLRKISQGLKIVFNAKLLKFTTWIKSFDVVQDFLKLMSGTFGKIAAAFGKIKSGFGAVTKFTGAILRFFTAFFPGLGAITGSLGKLAGFATKFFGAFSKLAAKVALPLTILLGLFDFAVQAFHGFIAGFKDGGWLGGLAEGFERGIIALWDTVVLGLLDLLKSGVSWIAGALGFDEIEKFLDSFSFKGLLTDFLIGMDRVIADISFKAHQFAEEIGFKLGEFFTMLPAKIEELISGVASKMGETFVGLKHSFEEFNKRILRHILPDPNKDRSFFDPRNLISMAVPDEVYAYAGISVGKKDKKKSKTTGDDKLRGVEPIDPAIEAAKVEMDAALLKKNGGPIVSVHEPGAKTINPPLDGPRPIITAPDQEIKPLDRPAPGIAPEQISKKDQEAVASWLALQPAPKNTSDRLMEAYNSSVQNHVTVVNNRNVTTNSNSNVQNMMSNPTFRLPSPVGSSYRM